MSLRKLPGTAGAVLLLAACTALPAVAQDSTQATTQQQNTAGSQSGSNAGSNPSSNSTDNSTYATGKPLQNQSKEGFYLCTRSLWR